MKLSKNSISSKLYRWFYCANELPVSLCPYFWQLVIAWVFLIPVAVIRLPLLLIADNNDDDDSSISIWQKIIGGLIVWFILFLIFCLLSPIALLFASFGEGFMSTSITWGILLWLIGIIVGIVLGIMKIKDNISDKRRANRQRDESGRIIIPEKRPSIVTEFVKAKYNKYCPKIEWIDSDDNTK